MRKRMVLVLALLTTGCAMGAGVMNHGKGIYSATERFGVDPLDAAVQTCSTEMPAKRPRFLTANNDASYLYGTRTRYVFECVE